MLTQARLQSAEFLREEQLREEAEAKDKELQALRSAIAESDGKLRTFETDLVFRQTYEHGTRALQSELQYSLRLGTRADRYC